jgi:hypothetical protein
VDFRISGHLHWRRRLWVNFVLTLRFTLTAGWTSRLIFLKRPLACRVVVTATFDRMFLEMIGARAGSARARRRGRPIS